MYEQIAANKRKTIGLMAGFFSLVGGLAWLLSYIRHDQSVFFLIGIFSIGYAIWGYFGASSAALGLNGAQQIEKSDAPNLWNTVENISITEGMPMPKVYIIQDSGLNAFATGRDPAHASVAITTGLLETLDKSELQGVMAHELGHVKNYDTRVSIIAFALVGIVSLVCDIFLRMSLWGGMGRNDDNENNNNGSFLFVLSIVALVLAPIVATLIQLAISRQREYLADATSAMTTRYPEGLARALEKIKDGGSSLRRQNSSTAHLFIANPLKGGFVSGLLSTHPPLDERIRLLRQMGQAK